MSDKDLFPHRWMSFHYNSLCDRRGKQIPLSLLYKGTNSIVRAPLSGPNHLLKAAPLPTIALEIRFQHRNLVEKGIQKFRPKQC
jgi:hypothetical protein